MIYAFISYSNIFVAKIAFDISIKHVTKAFSIPNQSKCLIQVLISERHFNLRYSISPSAYHQYFMNRTDTHARIEIPGYILPVCDTCKRKTFA